MNDGSWGQGTTPSSGSLKAKLRIINRSDYFYCLKPELPPKSQMTGSVDLLSAYDMGSVYNRFCGRKKVIQEPLHSFVPNIYGNLLINPNANDISSLRRLIEKPPITGKEILPLSGTSMESFKLNPGPVDERYRHLFDRKPEAHYPAFTIDPKTGLNRYKTSLEPLESSPAELEEPERKRNKDKKEKKKKKDKKKKDKKDDERKHKKASLESQGPGSIEF